MERHDQPLDDTQPGGPQPDLTQKLAELDRVLAGVRESLERIRASTVTEEGTEAAPGEGGGGRPEAGPPRREPAVPPSEESGGPSAQAREEGEAEGAAPGAEEAGGPRGETVPLFDGTAEAMRAWNKVGAGDCEYRDEQLQLRSGRDRGLVYFTEKRFDNFRLQAQYRLLRPEAPMSLAVRFLDPEQPVPDREDPQKKYRYDNQAYVAAHTGFEVFLGAGGGRAPGTLDGVPVGDEPGQQRPGPGAELRSDDWNALDLEVRGDDYTVRLNGVETTRFTNTDSWRGKPAAAGSDAGFVGFAMGEQPRQATHRPGPAVRLPGPPPLAGPILPGRPGGIARAGAGVPREGEAPAAFELAIRRVEVEMLGPAPQVRERDKLLARKELAALHAQVVGALARIKARDKGLEELLRKAYGYAVLPSVGRASLLLGGARGYGEVFEQGKPIGFTRVTQVTFGVQVGGQTFTQLLLFGSKKSLDAFKASPMAFNANLSAVFIRGGSGTTNFRDVTTHAYSLGGMLLEASLGGQKFRFIPADRAAQELAKPQAAATRVGAAGRAAKGLAGKITSKVGSVLKKSASK